MIIDNFDIEKTVFIYIEADPILTIDSYAVLSCPVTFQ